MKQRMLNTFTRKLKNIFWARVFTEIGYCALSIVYFIMRIFLKDKKNTKNITDEVSKNARSIVNRTRQKPKMTDEIRNIKIDKDVDLSIVMPVYNVEEYVENCILSIIRQNTTYKFELIIVNDGSKDGSEDIIQSIHDDRIKYIYQENKGLSGARNTGINNAVGKYITFVDSDDFMCENSIQNMMDATTKEEADICVGGYYIFTNESNVKQIFVSKNKIIENSPKEAINNPGYAWGKIYRRSLFEKLRFPLGAWYEDTIVCTVLYRIAKKIVVIDQPVYEYRINPEGISQTARCSVKSIDHYWVMEDILDKYEQIGLEYDEILFNLVLDHMSKFLYRRISLMPEETVENVFYMACEMINKLDKEYKINGSIMRKDIYLAFKSGNYKLWKAASFLV